MVEERSFVVRFVVLRAGAAVRITDVASSRQWLIADPDVLRALERAMMPPPITGKELQ